MSNIKSSTSISNMHLRPCVKYQSAPVKKMATISNFDNAINPHGMQMLLVSFSTEMSVLFYHCNKVHLATKSPMSYSRLRRYSFDAIENESIVTYKTYISRPTETRGDNIHPF